MMTSATSLILFFLFLSLLPLPGQSPVIVEASLESSLVVVGEETYLTLWTNGLSIIDWPDHPPKVAPLALKQDQKRRFQVNGYIREGFRYRLIAFQPGLYQIPPFQFRTPNGMVSSKPLTLRAFPVEQLSTHGVKIDGYVTPYLTGLFFEKTTPFVGEMQTVEAKLYLSQAPPNRLALYDGKVIQFAKDGLAAWRFTTTRDETGMLEYDGHRFKVYTYRSFASALREGPLTLGPGQSEAILAHRLQGISRTLDFPSASLDVRPLPAGAPLGFEGAVGNFQMNIRPLGHEITLGEALTVEIDITGSGNLNRFPGPKLIDTNSAWKQFEMIAKPGGAERRSITGTREFSQLLRPLTPVPALPPYRFIFFDPLTEKYQTLESPPIPITIHGNSGDETGPASLAFLTPGGIPLKSFHHESQWLAWRWQLIPATLALILIISGMRRWRLRQKISLQPALDLEAEIARVEGLSDDRIAFYREAARVAIQWRGGRDFDALFEKRDEVCFQPQPQADPIDREEKNKILKLLKTLTPLLIGSLIFLLLPLHARALSPDPAKAKDEILAEMALHPAPEHFHNLALCETKLGNNGNAVLWSYRFKLHGGDASALLGELPGTREKNKEWLDWISVLPRSSYLQLILAGAWGILLLALTTAFYRGKFRKAFLVFLAIASPTALALGIVSWFWYPDEISFEPLQNLSVVTGKAFMLSQPFDGAKTMRENLEGSLCKVTATRAGWSMITLPGGLSGWVRESEISPIIGETIPHSLPSLAL